MKNREQIISDFRVKWLPALALVIVLYLIYSPVFLTDYLMNDEWYHIGSRDNLAESAKQAFFVFGRGLYGIYSPLVYRFVQYNPFRVQFVRFVNFASLITIALVLFLFLEKRSKNSWLPFLVILFLFSQRSIQSAMAYSLVLINIQPAMWLSLLAFYVHFYLNRGRFPKLLRLIFVFLILILAMQSTQTYAFFSMVPLTYVTLTEWKNEKRKVLEFLLLACGVFLLSSLIYKVGLDYWHDLGKQGYGLGEQGLEAVTKQPVKLLLHAINPFAYWGAFEIWSYPFPFHYILPLKEMKRNVACFIMTGWGLLILFTIITELRGCPAEERRQVLLKWLAVFIYLGFGAIFLIADSPLRIEEHRPHMTLSFAGVAIFCAAYCVQVLASKHLSLRSAVVKSLGIIFVATIAFGAQAGILRGFVNNRMEQLNFIRTELVTGDRAGCRNIVVVLPEWSGCMTEPCGPWVGHVTEDQSHIKAEGAYRYALATTGISPEGKNITFAEERPAEIPEDSIIIDWNKYASARKAHRKYLRHIAPFRKPAILP